MTLTSSPSAFLGAKLHQAPVDPSLALCFPGQGSQKPGMGKDVFQTSAAARAVYRIADDVLGTPLSRLCFEGPEDELTRTANAQPAILVTSVALLAAALEGEALARRPSFCAGHSLGEYTALVSAGALAFEDALLLVQERGRLMEEAGQEQPGTMAAIVGLNEEAVEAICAEAGAEPCNYNAPGQVVIGGTPEAVEAACRLAKERGGRGLPLRVSGAFHTSLMDRAAARFSDIVARFPVRDPVVPVIGNVSGAPLQTAEDVRRDLQEQIRRPVRWHQSVTRMIDEGVASFVEVGPGRVLTTMLKRAAPQVKAIPFDSADALAIPTDV